MEQAQLRGRSTLAALVCLALACAAILSGCGVTASAGGSGQPIAYDAHTGSILVQLFPSPGFMYPSVNGVPTWTLYGDGTLVYVSGESASASDSAKLSEARLTPDQVQHILDVVVNQYAFFASDKSSYGRMIPDTGSTLLAVNAAGQSKTVALYGDEGSSPDAQTRNVFAIESFLQGYHPSNVQPYTPHGVAVVVYPASGSAQPASTWPDSSVDLAATEAAECPYLQPKPACHTPVDGPLGIKTIRGPIGTSLLTQPGPQATVTQNGSAYLVLVWPLLPDVPPVTTHPGGNPGTASIRVAYGNQIHEWPLMSENGVPIGA